MGLRRIQLCQLGDVHYPDHTGDLGADNDGFTDEQVRSLTSSRLKQVLEMIADFAQEDTYLALSGDLTSRGNVTGYEGAVQYLNGILHFADRPDRLVTVPGNHDIDRQSIIPGETDHFKKFVPLTAIWDTVSAGMFRPDTVRRIDIPGGTDPVPVLALNTCVLCWEYRDIPTYWQVTAQALLEGHTDADTARALVAKLKSLQVDAPSIHESHLEQIHQEVTRHPALCVIVGHHALLPQARPRLQINGEPLNAGRLRTTLLRDGSPILYLHGHLHDDPVECISNPPECQFIASIGAPALADGFNLIEIALSSEDTFLGFDLGEYRFKNDHLELIRSRRFKNGTLSEQRLGLLKRVARLVGVEETVTAQDIRVRSVRAQLDELDLSDDSVGGCLAEADWMGLLAVDDKGGANLAEWRITA